MMMKRKLNWKRFFRDYFLILVGCSSAALAYALFLVPNKIPPGGVSSLSMILHYLIHTPFGMMLLLLNIPLFIASIKTLGRMFGVRTLVGIILLALLSDLFVHFLKDLTLTDSRLLATLYGGLLLGVGLGFVFRGGGSTGGTDIIGRIVAKYTNRSTGFGIMVTDVIIVALFSLIFKSYETALYGFIALFVSSKTIDIIIEGRDYARAAFIFSTKADKIAERIIKELDRGVTRLYGEGMYTHQGERILFCVTTRKEVSDLRYLVKGVDPDAFMIITNVHEVLGRGFKPRTEPINEVEK